MREQFREGALLHGRYQVESPLNRGAYGVVMLAKDLQTDQHVAIKCLAKASLVADDPSATRENPSATPEMPSTLPETEHAWELYCHQQLGSHPGLVELLDHFETAAHVYLVLEFCPNGDLFEAIRCERGPSKTEQIRVLMLQLVHALEHMHGRGFYHRDVKPENIFLAQNGNMKLGDFGLVTREAWSWEAAVGTQRYMAPEQYDPGEVGYAPAQADIWAVGITLINVVFGRSLFDVPAESDVHFADYLRNPESLFDKYPTMTADMFDVLVHALAIDPTRRSFEAFRQALVDVESFSTDDGSIDFFCRGDRQIVPVSANRQPLPTPSLKKASGGDQPENASSVPWTDLLRATANQIVAPTRRLSTVVDANEKAIVGSLAITVPELDAGRTYETEGIISDDDPHSPSAMSASFVPGTPSVGAVDDCGLSTSLMSLDFHPGAGSPSVPVTMEAAQQPVRAVPASRPQPIPSLSSIFGRKGDSVSKSWYDICDEEEEEAAGVKVEAKEERRRASADGDVALAAREIQSPKSVGLAAPAASTSVGHVSSPAAVPVRRAGQPKPARLPFFGLDGFDERDSDVSVGHPPRVWNTPKHRYSPPRQDIMDKWAALGRRRRAFDASPVPVNVAGVGAGDWTIIGGGGSGSGGFGRKGAAKVPIHDQSDDLELVGGWHHLELTS